MQYTILNVGERQFKLRATATSIVNLEKQLGGQNPLNILMGMESGHMPSVTAVLHILHAALVKYHGGMSFAKVMELYDQFIDEGNSYTDLLPVLSDVFKVSGFFKGAPTTENETEEPSL